MSHFVVMVVGADSEGMVEKALHPFWELDLSQEEARLDPRAEFCVEIAEDKLQEKFEEFLTECPTQEQVDYAFEHFLRPKPQLTPLDKLSTSSKVEPIQKDSYHKWLKEYNLTAYKVEEKFTKDRFANAQEWMNNWYGDMPYEKGKGWGYWRNPNAQWDWYQIGGRWAGYWRLKEGRKGEKGEPSLMLPEEEQIKIASEPLTADIALKRDIDFEGMILENKANAEKTWAKYKRMLKSGKDFHPYFQFGIEEGDTRKKYIERRASIATFAVLKDGKWYERGKMGWWGCVSDEKEDTVWINEFRKLLTDLPEDTPLAIVDCHI